MKRTRLHALNPESAQKRIKAAKSNKPFMAALLDRDHRGHKDAVDQWTRLHKVAFPEPASSTAISRARLAAHPLQANELRSSRLVGRSGTEDRVSTQRRSEGPTQVSLQATQDGEGRSSPERTSGDEDEQERPVVNMSADRIRVLQDNASALFEIEDNSDADSSYGAGRSDHRLGSEAVGRYASVVEEEARRQGVDPDWVKAIMYVENAHGWYGPLFEAIGMAKTLFPMNINPALWSTLSDQPADLSDPRANIRNAVTLIRRITERVDEPTLAKVASIWIFAGAEQVSDYGARVQDVHDNKIWATPFTPLPSLSINAP